MVLLGFIDEPKGNKTLDDDPSNWTISRIGGEPAFPTSNLFDELKSKLICSKCKFDKVFVCQLYCPLDGHRYDRSIYLFACRNPSCWNQSESWTSIRCQKFDELVEETAAVVPTQTPKTTKSTDWCDDANAWDDDETQEEQEEKIQTKLPTVVMPKIPIEKMKINDDEEEKSSTDDDDEEEIDSKTKTKKNVSVASSDAFAEWKRTNLKSQLKDFRSFPFFYIEIDDEETIINDAKLDEMKKLKKQVKKLEEIDEDADLDDENAKRPKEKYEKTPSIEHGDVVFYRFQQKIRYAPEQIIRYDWSGQPLILTKIKSNELSSVEKCRHCQSSCHFEFQLMPSLVNFLKIDGEVALEFGTVFVYTCSKNCWDEEKDLYRFENVFVQTDPDQILFE